jgi:hypothetical protein
VDPKRIIRKNGGLRRRRGTRSRRPQITKCACLNLDAQVHRYLMSLSAKKSMHSWVQTVPPVALPVMRMPVIIRSMAPICRWQSKLSVHAYVCIP